MVQDGGLMVSRTTDQMWDIRGLHSCSYIMLNSANIMVQLYGHSIISYIFNGAYRVSVKKGGSITIPCRYDLKYKNNVKYFCKVGHLQICSPDVKTDPFKSIDKASISHDIIKQTFTVTMTDLGMEDSGRYRCAVEINGGSDVIIERFQLSVTPGTPELYVDQQEVTEVEGGSVIVKCYYRNTGNRKWCKIRDSVQCVWENSGTTEGKSVTLQQTTDATRGNVLTVTMSGLKMENTGWYRCGVGDLMMPVHITVRQQTTTQSTSTMTTAEPVQTDNTVQGPEGGKEKDTMSSIDLKVLLIPLGMLVVVISGVLVTWKIWRKHKDNKATDQTTNTSVVEPDDNVVYSSLALQLDLFPVNGDDVTYSTVVPKRRNQLNVQTKGEPDNNVVYSSPTAH